MSTVEWETPQELFDELDAEFGFNLDVCATKKNAKCPKYYNRRDNSLTKLWRYGICWMNPPYNECAKWVKKAYEESQKGATVVCLLPSKTDTAWWHDYCERGEYRFVRNRIHFTDPAGKTGRPRFGSVVVIFRARKEK